MESIRLLHIRKPLEYIVGTPNEDRDNALNWQRHVKRVIQNRRSQIEFDLTERSPQGAMGVTIIIIF